MIYITQISSSWGMRRHQAPIATLIVCANRLGRVEEMIKGETDIDTISDLIDERYTYEALICLIVEEISATTARKPY